MNKIKIKSLINVIALLVMLAGGLGMLYCFTYLFSNDIIDVVGAGVPFAAGAVLVGTGLIALAINNKGN